MHKLAGENNGSKVASQDECMMCISASNYINKGKHNVLGKRGL